MKHISHKLHCAFDTDSGGANRGLVFQAKRTRSSPPVKSGIDPAIIQASALKAAAE